ncbi:MAG: hypothetical protein HN427_05515 [Flavobacteriales bacterium]|nr:hypothetical protein [Flavobacteriales bacterium]MBT7480906.1 hypothetical protein [Flavobacteriales bacterium]
MKNYLEHKADFKHKLGIKFYMISLTLLLVKQFPILSEAPWWIYLAILSVSYIYCLKRLISS